jgi:AAA15 family ATPase/GTPase
MVDIFIQRIKVNKARNLVDFDIPLSEDSKKHLIITGKNGSGKTSLLNEIKVFLNKVISKEISMLSLYHKAIEEAYSKIRGYEYNPKINDIAIRQIQKEIEEYQNQISDFGGTEIYINNAFEALDFYEKGKFIIAFFEAKRNINYNNPIGINPIDFKLKYDQSEFAGKDFVQYIVNLKADRSFAKDDNDDQTAEKIDKWFENFEQNLFSLFDTPNMRLSFDRKTYNFNLIEGSKEPYNFNQLSGGFSAIMNILSELIIRMEKHRTKSYDVQGVVLIDEIETHLHIDLQKKILPFPTSFFPKIQFIVTTHSPFVLSSIDNTVICDLEKRIVTNDLSGYSYDTLIESYFNSDKYSHLLKQRIERYETLTKKNELSEEESGEFLLIKRYLKEIPKFISDELAVKLQQIRLKELSKKETT